MPAPTLYTFSIATDFSASHKCAGDRLTREIQRSPIVTALDYVSTQEQQVEVLFKDPLNSVDSVHLHYLLTVHSGTFLPDGPQPVILYDPNDSDRLTPLSASDGMFHMKDPRATYAGDRMRVDAIFSGTIGTVAQGSSGSDPWKVEITNQSSSTSAPNRNRAPKDISRDVVALLTRSGSVAMNVDGSSAKFFTFSPTVGMELDTVRIILSDSDVQFQGTKFGNINKITNGLLLQVRSSGTTYDIGNFKKTEDLVGAARGKCDVLAGEQALVVDFPFDGTPLVSGSDYVRALVRDDIDGLKNLEVYVFGRKS